MNKKFFYLLITAFILVVIFALPDDQPSEGIQVAVASNFSETIKRLSKSFAEKSGTKSAAHAGAKVGIE